MAYKRIKAMDIYEIIRRYHSGQKINHISKALNYDRKTVRKYITTAKENGMLNKAIPLPDKSALLQLFIHHNNEKEHQRPAQELLTPYLDEILNLVNHPSNALKPKLAYEVICQRHQLTQKISYSSFKRFYRKHCLTKMKTVGTCRIETEPGQFLQIDYAKMGLLFDPILQKNRTVYAFIATLSFSRHKYVEFVYKQDQKSFIASHVKAFNYFNGVPHIILLDNLKTGVIKPNLYEPTLNRNYQEMAQHYHTFLDPCRVKHPKDKAKVERDVQTVRDQFRKFLALNPRLTIAEANHNINTWCRDEYGQRPHGTTNQPPFQLFINQEKKCLKPLTLPAFELAEWKKAKVHPDSYIQYQKQFFSVPYQYIGKVVWIKATGKILSVYFNDQVVKKHLITPQTRHTDFKDFPDNVAVVLDDAYRQNLIKEAFRIGPSFYKAIRQLLTIHAFINLRRAQAIVNLKDKYQKPLLEETASYLLNHRINLIPANFVNHLEQLQQDHNSETSKSPTIGKQTQSFVRSIDYFFNQKPKSTGDAYEPN